MEKTHERLEHIEHTKHAAHDWFDRRVAMTMAIVAAALACVTLLSHRSHNDTLRLQNEGNTLKTEASVLQNIASDEWAYYQAKNIRRHEYEAYLRLLPVLAHEPGTEDKCKEAEAHWSKEAARYTRELKEQQAKAKGLEEKRDEKLHEAEEKFEASHHVHHQADRFDLGELAVELALVLCSISVLTKQSSFWFVGIVCGVIGIIIAVTAFLIH